MKFVLLTALLVLSILGTVFSNKASNRVMTESLMQMHLQMATQMKTQTRSLLHSLYKVSNNLPEINSDFVSENREQEIDRRMGEYRGEHSSKVDHHHHVKSHQYNHRDFHNVTVTLKRLAKEHPDYIILTTAQKEFGLPHPGGYCGEGERKKRCSHYIVYLSNHKISSRSKPQIYISGTVHGNERVGPTASIELIKLFVENREDPYIKHLLDNRYIVITPMTNPYGYYKNVREELLIKDDDQANINFGNYEKYHKDINRDFPYLVQNHECMETIGARVVNELFLKHLFSLSLSFHGGTESFTYPFGTPNHIDNNKNIIPMKYITKHNKTIPKPNSNSFKMAELYKTGKFDMMGGKSTPPPDNNAMSQIAISSAGYNNNKNYKSYQVGDMSSVVYPVRGGMEDWAYSGSWEGYPIITQPCEPHTYKGYDPNKTLYEKYYKESLKSIMFLLEISHNKFPEQFALGRKNNNCLINLKRNAFFNKKAPTRSCLDPLSDGYIPRILRLSMALIDLLEPYVNFQHKIVKSEEFTFDFYLKWTVGGAINVEETVVLFEFVNDPTEIKEKVSSAKRNSDLFNIFKFKSKPLKGHGVWNQEFNDGSYFNYHAKFKSQKKHLVFVILAKSDSSWGINQNSDPPVNPQTHIANLRNNDNYVVKNENFKLKGNVYRASELKVINLN